MVLFGAALNAVAPNNPITGTNGFCSRKKIIPIFLFLFAACAIAGIWFYVDVVVEAEANFHAEQEAAAQRAEQTAQAEQGGDIFGIVKGGAETALGEVGKFGKNLVDTLNPMNLLKTAWQWMLYWGSIIGAAGTGLTGLAGTLYASDRTLLGAGDKTAKNCKYWGFAAAIFMVAAMCCAHYCPTVLMGWLAKGLAILGAVAAIASSFFLWKEPPVPEAGTVPLSESEYSCSASMPAGAPASATTHAIGAPMSLPGSRSRRLIEQKFRFSDHSLLLAASIALVSAAVYGFIQESKYSESATPKLRSKRRFRTGIP